MADGQEQHDADALRYPHSTASRPPRRDGSPRLDGRPDLLGVFPQALLNRTASVRAASSLPALGELSFRQLDVELAVDGDRSR